MGREDVLNDMKLSYKHHSIPAIYQIKNLVDGKVYIGGTKNYYSRVKGHIHSAKGKSAHPRKIISALIKYGIENFVFSIIEITPRDIDILTKREQYWIDKLCSYEDANGYNMCRYSNSTRGMKHPSYIKGRCGEFITVKLGEYSDIILDGLSNKFGVSITEVIRRSLEALQEKETKRSKEVGK